MKLTVLVDNNTLTDRYFYGEPAVSYYIEDEDTKILFDTGYSDLFIRNARRLHMDLSQLRAVAISHGHVDHTGGLPHFTKEYDTRATKIIAHPDAFYEKVFDGMGIGSPITEDELRKSCGLILTSKPARLGERFIFLGEIPQSNDFETRNAIGKKKVRDEFVDDYVKDDSALVYQAEKGIYIITGCSHSGICNIIEYAKEVCECNDVLGVIGGFHLFDPSARLGDTIKYFVKNDIRELYPCHCVSLKAKAEMDRHIPVKEVGVGMEIVW